MNTGYISSDFMEIRQHLAHYGVKGMKWKEHKKNNNPHALYVRDNFVEKTSVRNGEHVTRSMETSKNGMPTNTPVSKAHGVTMGRNDYLDYEERARKYYDQPSLIDVKEGKSGMPSNLQIEAENIRSTASDQKWKLRKKKADSLRAYNAERYRVGR